MKTLVLWYFRPFRAQRVYHFHIVREIVLNNINRDKNKKAITMFEGALCRLECWSNSQTSARPVGYFVWRTGTQMQLNLPSFLAFSSSFGFLPLFRHFTPTNAVYLASKQQWTIYWKIPQNGRFFLWFRFQATFVYVLTFCSNKHLRG